MDHIEYPTIEQWETRRKWFEEYIYHYEELDSYRVGEQASALISDVQSCFCSGAWVAVIILSFTVIEANIQEICGTSKPQRAVELLKNQGWNDTELDHLRKRRNTLIHATPDRPAITIDKQWDDRCELEIEARKAVELMFLVFYSQMEDMAMLHKIRPTFALV